jgi:hypothetical protein
MTSAGVVLLWMRRSGGVPLGVGALVVASWLVTAVRVTNPPLWADVGHAVEYTVLYLGPLVAGVTAWQAGRQRRSGTDELLASAARSEPGRAMALIGGQVAWAGVGMAGTMAWLVIVTAQAAVPGGPDWELAGAGLAGLFACAAIGYAVGATSGTAPTAPVVAIGLWIGIWLIGVGETPIRLLSPLLDGEPSPLYPIPISIGLSQIFWFSAIGTVAVVASTLNQTTTWKSGVVSGSALAIAVVSAVTLTNIGSPFARSVGPDYHAACEGTEVEVCVHPAFGALLPEAVPVAERVLGDIQRATGWPTRLLQVASRADAAAAEAADPQVLAFTGSIQARQGGFSEEGLAWGIASAIAGGEVCRQLPPDDPLRIGLVPWLAFRSTPGADQNLPDLAFIGAINELPPEDQQRWLAANIEAIHDCQIVKLP